MDTLLIIGGKDLTGSIEAGGSKNAALPLIAASLLIQTTTVLRDIPDITDVRSMIGIAESLGVKAEFSHGNLSFDYRNLAPVSLLTDQVKSLRASYYFAPVLAKFLPSFSLALPGGCNFAPRPIDLHRKMFAAFGLESTADAERVIYRHDKLHGTTFDFPYKSVGATVNAVLLAAIIPEVTTLTGIAIEPEIKCLLSFLKEHGVDLTVIGDTVIIKGQREFKNKQLTFDNIKDRIESGTYLILGALRGQPLTVKKCPVADLASLFDIFKRLNIKYFCHENEVTVYKTYSQTSLSLRSGPFPDFPSDLLPLMVSYLGSGTQMHMVEDTIYPSRYSYADELGKLGYVLSHKKDSLIIFPKKIKTDDQMLEAKDLRGGASMVLAALDTPAVTHLKGYSHVKRGYANMVAKLRKAGAEIDEE